MLSPILLQAAGSMTPVFNIFLMVAMLGIFYFLIFRPQLQRQKKQQSFFTDIQKGDKVVTTGGIHGKIAQVKEDYVLLDVSSTVQLKVATTAISMELSKGLQANKPKIKSTKAEVENS